MKKGNKIIITLLFATSIISCKNNDNLQTICNPLNIGYQFENNEVIHRDICAPCVVYYKNTYYLFASYIQGGYFSSEDLIHWKFISSNLPKDVTDPTVVEINDRLYLTCSFRTSTIFTTNAPESGIWEIATENFPYNVSQPMLFYDEERLFMYSGMGSLGTLSGIEIDPHTWCPIDSFIPLITTHKENGWEIPGDNNEWTLNPTWIEGAWMTKHSDTYYLLYATPSGYLKSLNDGVYVSNTPMGPFKQARHNPFSYKPEGFITGAGNGCIFQDQYGNYWHLGTSPISTKHIFERRLALHPVFFDNDGISYTYTGWGDYPMIIPKKKINSPQELQPEWMLLSYLKRTEASSEVRHYPACCAVDENIRSWWSAQTGNKGEYLTVDLGESCKVNAIQINFADHDFTLSECRDSLLYYQYQIEASDDNKHWSVIADRSHNQQNAPHDYIQLEKPVRKRYIKITNLHCPAGKFSLSGFRIFGKAEKPLPSKADFYMTVRDSTDRRKVILKWKPIDNATGYAIRYGIAPDKLYHQYLVYDDTEITIRSLQASQSYYFTIDSFNEGGITHNEKTLLLK